MEDSDFKNLPAEIIYHISSQLNDITSFMNFCHTCRMINNINYTEKRGRMIYILAIEQKRELLQIIGGKDTKTGDSYSPHLDVLFLLRESIYSLNDRDQFCFIVNYIEICSKTGYLIGIKCMIKFMHTYRIRKGILQDKPISEVIPTYIIMNSIQVCCKKGYLHIMKYYIEDLNLFRDEIAASIIYEEGHMIAGKPMKNPMIEQRMISSYLSEAAINKQYDVLKYLIDKLKIDYNDGPRGWLKQAQTQESKENNGYLFFNQPPLSPYSVIHWIYSNIKSEMKTYTEKEMIYKEYKTWKLRDNIQYDNPEIYASWFKHYDMIKWLEEKGDEFNPNSIVEVKIQTRLIEGIASMTYG